MATNTRCRCRPFLVAGLLALLLAGCGAAGQDDATAAALRFTRLLAAGDYTGACALVAPAVLRSLDQPCPKLARGLPAAGGVDDVAVFGRMAQAATGADTVFLVQQQGGWQVWAAGCTGRGDDLPRDCTLAVG